MKDLYNILLKNINKITVDELKELISEGLDVNYGKYLGQKPVYIAYSYCRHDLVICLLENGADPNIIMELSPTKKTLLWLFFQGDVQGGSYELKFSNWLHSYKGQKIMIEHHPITYKSLCDCEKVHRRIKKEFKHLSSVIDLNLL